MELATAVDFAETRQQSVLATIRANGRPQLSSVPHSVDVEGAVDLSPVVEREDDPVIDELLDHYRALRGPDLDWDVYRAAQLSERRVLVRLQPDRAYGMLQMPPAPEEKV